MRLLRWISNSWQKWETALPRCAAENCPRDVWGNRVLARQGIHLQGAWYCSPQCFEAAARRHFMRAAVAVLPTPRAQHRIPLGLLMLSRGELDNRQLRSALQAQHDDGCGLIGAWLEKLGFATEQQITTAL